jgi:anti-sigma regulatory factor (Ser/Thr protein kinase)
MRWRLPRQPASVPIARHTLDAVLELLAVTESCRLVVATMITEACSNAVQHGDGDEFAVDIATDARCCVIEVIDAGPGLSHQDIDRIAAPGTVDLAAEHGRGLLIIRAYSDQLDLRQAMPHGLHIRMAKNLTTHHGVDG